VSNVHGDETAFARIDEVVEGAVEQGQAPGVVAAVARGEIVHVAMAGAMAVGGEPMRRDTLFRISSTTKPMTAAAVLSLVDDGLLELNGPVDELLPELADRRVLRSCRCWLSRASGGCTNRVRRCWASWRPVPRVSRLMSCCASGCSARSA
jgi:CubicO group peptidase (beta-lactamase class C family)